MEIKEETRVNVDLEHRKYEHALRSKSRSKLQLECERCELVYNKQDTWQQLYFALVAHRYRMLKAQADMERNLAKQQEER